MELSEVIRQHIYKEGPVSFHDFMEMALYYPGLGYYTAASDRIGKNGDFYTSSNLTPVFGAMIGKQLEEMWHLTGANDFTVVEYGAGTGMLCYDILNYLKENQPLYDRLHYAIIEKSDPMRKREQTLLHEKVAWYRSIHELKGLTGCILSNELLDNFAVYQVVMQDELMEVFVDDKDGFTELLRPARKALKDYLAELNITLPKGYRTEINLEAVRWIQDIASSLKKGYVMTIDYGYSSEDLYKSSRSRGTLLCYYKHQVNDCPYSNVGKQDITAHVNFSALCHWGLKNGLACCGLTSQANFLLNLGFKDYLRKTDVKVGDTTQLAMEEVMLTHTLLVDMGNKFKVLIQQKGVPAQQLSGLKCL
ncbi:MAG TPA: SAM-dependent methyltransferase [Mucilaginibacter sp.]|jgi:SAM-dependent MidA family methyltransferase